MGKQPFISHAVNGYSRYDVPESKAFTCTPGILYPVRIDFINARDRVSIEQGVDVRSNPLAVPTFNPYTIRLHRFWVPLQLYHPELRTNSSKFDMNSLSLNWICSTFPSAGSLNADYFGASYTNSLFSWLRVGNKYNVGGTALASVNLPASATLSQWSNADTYLAYWDIVRNYYGYSQWGLYSFAWPMANKLVYSGSKYILDPDNSGDSRFFTQCYGSLEFLDAFYESQFYPSAVASTNNSFNRGNLFYQIVRSDLKSDSAASSDGYPVVMSYPSVNLLGTTGMISQILPSTSSTASSGLAYFLVAHPMAVVPSNPDRFSRLVPVGSSSAVSMTGVTTIPQLAIASRLQEYKDLLGAGGSRYSDWLETFFASKIEHVDRPKLLFSASQTINVQVVMNQAGDNNFSGSQPLGQQGGAIAFNDRLGRRQSYYFREPGYLVDMLSIRPVYYWSFIKPDYLNYSGSDYFNPIYNDIGYQDVPAFRIAFNGNPGASSASEPCFNEFRSSYDEVLGQLQAYYTSPAEGGTGAPLYSYWVQQRAVLTSSRTGSLPEAYYYPLLFTDLSQVNSPFSSTVEDNFFVNLSYSVQKKNLVNKTFATRLSNR